MGDISVVPLYAREATIVESGMNQRRFLANFQTSAEPATAAGAALGKTVPCTNLPPAPLPLPLLLRIPCQAPQCWSEGSGQLSFIPALERTSNTYFL